MGGCPFHSSGDEGDGEDPSQGDRGQTVERRDFIRSALLIGGASAVGSLGSVAGVTTSVRAEKAPISAEARLNRQHAWDAYEALTASGNTKPPNNSLFLMLNYGREGEPSPGHRRRVETALGEIERHFEWRTNGVLFTMAYSASYFDRFDERPPAGAAPDDAETVASTVEGLTDLADTNDDVEPDTADAMLLLASDNAANLLAVEGALWGDSEELDFEATFEGIFEQPDEWPDRRVGFLGPAFQQRAQEYEDRFLDDDQDVPDDAPLSMGFVAGFGDSIPAEEHVTLKRGQVFPGPGTERDDVSLDDIPYVEGCEFGERDPGVFAQGTLKHVSHLEIDLPEWYDTDPDRRRHQMYSPYHDERESRAMGGTKPGSGLTDRGADDPDDVGPDDDRYDVREYAERTPDTAAGTDEDADVEAPTAGHSQKVARARYDVDGDGEPEQPVLRRDWDAITPTNGDDTAGYLFNVATRFNESVYSMLDANYNIEFTSLDGGIEHGPVANAQISERNGIAPFMTAIRRGNWLVPPITLRALPAPRASEVSISVRTDGEMYAVEVRDVARDGGAIDPETVRFGAAEAVNQAGGAAPTNVSRRSGAVVVEFPVDETALSGGQTAKLFGKRRGTRTPVVGTTTL
jgi:hypothetical protein